MFSYKNIGCKIKGLATVIFIVEAVVSLIYGLVLIASSKFTIVFGILLIVFGPILAWVGSWLLYGFGQLIENSDIIADSCDIIISKGVR